jgi:hypothetical protein
MGSGGQIPLPGAGLVAGTMDPIRRQIREQLTRLPVPSVLVRKYRPG